MRPIAVLLRLAVSTALLLVSAYTIATVTLPVGDVAAQTTRTTVTTHEAIIIREGRPLPEITVRQPPPPPREESRLAPPPSQVWVPGYWAWNNDWVWVEGRAERPPERMAAWVPGQWTPRGDTWIWRPGHWE